jgi:hypothetical protein
MRKLTAIILSFSALGILPVASFAEDQVQVAEQLLESAFACPVPPATFYEMDTPLTSIPRATFSRNSTGFRVTVDERLLFKNDAILRFAGDETAARNGKPREAHRQTTVSANYADLAGTEIVKENVGRLLRIKCGSESKCIHIQGTADYGSERGYQNSEDGTSFQFCDDATLQNAKAAFDSLIATAAPTQPLGATRTVKSAVSGGYINLREGPGLDRAVLIQIPAGESIVVDESRCRPGSDGKTKLPFCPVTWKGQKGWASASGFE